MYDNIYIIVIYLNKIHNLLDCLISAMTESPISNTPANGKEGNDEHHVAVAANETVGTSEGQTIMIIQAEEPLTNVTVSEQDTSLSNIDVEVSYMNLPLLLIRILWAYII